MSVVRLWKDLGRWKGTAGDIAVSSPMQLVPSCDDKRVEDRKIQQGTGKAGRKCLQMTLCCVLGGRTLILVIIV